MKIANALGLHCPGVLDYIYLDGPWSAQVYTNLYRDDEPFLLSRVDFWHGRGQMMHYCRDDCYSGQWILVSDSMFEVQWHCFGPSKEYRILATYTAKCN